MTLRALGRINLLGLPFYVPYGVERLGASHVGGIMIGCMSVSRLLSSLLWGRLRDSRGTRVCLVSAGMLFTVSPLAVVLAPRLPPVFALPLPYTDVPLDLPFALYMVALSCFGLGMEASIIGTNAFMLESAPSDRRASYVAFLNTLTLPLTFLPAVAGALVGSEADRLTALFLVVAASGILTWITARSLGEYSSTDASVP